MVFILFICPLDLENTKCSMMSANDFGKTDFKELLPKHIKSVKDLERLSAQMNIFNT